MSKNANGYMGIQIGKLGPAIAQMWKGRNVYRSHNPFIHDPKTDAQRQVRTRFGAINQLARALSPAINAGFAYKADAEHTTTRGIFVHINWPFVTVQQAGESLQPQFDFQSIVLSEGPVPTVAFGTPTAEADTVTIPITDNFSGIGCALDSDQVNVIMYDKDKDMSITANALRTANNVVLSYPASWAGDEVELYGYVTTSVTEPTYVPAYSGNVYPQMSSPSSHIATLTIN